jgi:redox-sensitive bicupin YhaK (pirin superfamily)
MHGLQLWVASPERTRHQPARFEHHNNLPVVERDGIRAIILVGEFMGEASPALVDTPLVGVDLTVSAGTSSLPLSPLHEHAVMVIDGVVEVAGERLAPGPLLYLGTNRDAITVTSTAGAHLILLGGEPFDEELVMWWNYIGRSHEEIVQARDAWEADDGRFGVVPGHGERIPAPPLPGVRLRARRRHPVH